MLCLVKLRIGKKWNYNLDEDDSDLSYTRINAE